MEITSEMIGAGIGAWQEHAGDEFPHGSITHDLVVEAIYRAMRLAAQKPQPEG